MEITDDMTATQILGEICVAILDGLDGPIHYRMLYQSIIDAEMFDMTIYKKPTDSLWNALNKEVKEKRRIISMGRGIFVSMKIAGDIVDQVAVEPSVRTKSLPMLHQPGSRLCGDCALASYTGIQMTIRETAMCGSETSGRFYVKRLEPSCGNFREKSESHLYKEHQQALADKALIDAVNLGIHKRKVVDAR